MPTENPLGPADGGAPEPTERFAEAWRRGRAIRRKKLIATGSASGAVLLACALALTVVPPALGPDGLSQLQPAGPPDETPSPAPSEPGPSLEPTPAGDPNGHGSPSPTPEASAGPVHEGSPSPGGGAAGTVDPGPRSREVTRRYYDGSPVTSDDNGVRNQPRTICGVDLPTHDDASGANTDWCGRGSIVPGRTGFEVTHVQCRADDGEQEALRFKTAQEVELEVTTPSGVLLWRWSDHYPVEPAAHVLTADPGGCFHWSTVWNGVTDDGTSLGPGSYVLRTIATADELGPADASEQEFTVAAEPEPTTSP